MARIVMARMGHRRIRCRHIGRPGHWRSPWHQERHLLRRRMRHKGVGGRRRGSFRRDGFRHQLGGHIPWSALLDDDYEEAHVGADDEGGEDVGELAHISSDLAAGLSHTYVKLCVYRIEGVGFLQGEPMLHPWGVLMGNECRLAAFLSP